MARDLLATPASSQEVVSMPETYILEIVQQNGPIQLENLVHEILQQHQLDESDVKAGLWRLVAASAIDLRPDNSVAVKQHA
jgi:hypothetical protein